MTLSLSRRLPLYCVLASVALGVILIPWPAAARIWLSGETGLIELLTVAFALWGCWTAILITKDGKLLPQRWMMIWFGFFALGLFVLAGEECSWGQSWFKWQTPEGYAAINRQGETNLHNLSSVTEELPKTLLLVGALLGGIIWPIRAWAKKTGPYLGTGWLSWIWPSSLIWPAAAIAWFCRIAERLLVATDLEDLIRAPYIATRESIELYLVLFVLAYLWDVRRRMLSQTA